MDYDIYFHNDFDGRASAAIMLSFLEERGDRILDYYPVDFRIKGKWPKLKFARPTIIVDFIYHPRAAFWYDHHITTFINNGWKSKFSSDKFHRLNTKYASCTHLVLDSLKKDFGFKPPKILVNLAKELDIVDGARYKSPEQAVMFKEPRFQIDKFIDYNARGHDHLSWLIDILRKQPLIKIVKDKRISGIVSRLNKERNRALEFYKSNLQIFGKVSFIDLTKDNLIDLRFAPYYLVKSGLLYNVSIKKSGESFRLSAGTNPWNHPKNTVNIGGLLEKYGGGGHKVAGGLIIKTENEKNKIVKEVIGILNG